MRKGLLAGNQSHFAGLNLRNAPADLSKLRLSDVWRNIVGKALHNSVSELGALLRGKLLHLFEDLGNRLSHEIRIQRESNPDKCPDASDEPDLISQIAMSKP